MTDLKELIEALNTNQDKTLSAKDWSLLLPKRIGPYGSSGPSESSQAAKIGQWLRIFAHLGFIKITKAGTTGRGLSVTYNPVKTIEYFP